MTNNYLITSSSPTIISTTCLFSCDILKRFAVRQAKEYRKYFKKFHISDNIRFDVYRNILLIFFGNLKPQHFLGPSTDFHVGKYRRHCTEFEKSRTTNLRQGSQARTNQFYISLLLCLLRNKYGLRELQEYKFTFSILI